MPSIPSCSSAPLAGLLCLMSASASAQIAEYEASSREQGSVRVDMGTHDFCALSSVTSGGFNSHCTIQRQGRRWQLVAHDPPAPDAFVGETQHCRAVCLSTTASSVSDVRPQPPSSPPGQPAKPRADGVPDRATVNGRYSGLLQVVNCPADAARYGDFREWGHATTANWCGTSTRAGYWVYVKPNWYIWEHRKP